MSEEKVLNIDGVTSEQYEVFDKVIKRLQLMMIDWLDEIEAMEIDPKPDTVLRIRFLFFPLDDKIETIPPEIAVPPERQGFTVVEWGGLIFDE